MTLRHWRWIATLCRNGCPPPGAPWPKRAMLLACLAIPPAHAATLRTFRELASPTVRLSDLFASLDATPDRDLGPSPAPGDRIVVEAPQLAAIARDYGVAWRPNSGAERAVLERGGTPMPAAPILAALRQALRAAGAPDQADMDMPGFTAPVLPSGTQAQLSIDAVDYDAGTSRFTAVLTVTAAEMAPLQQRLSGQVVAVVEAASLTRHVHPGLILQAADMRVQRVREASLHGSAPVVLEAAIGMALRHDVPPGQPLTSADIARPVLVARNALVRMRLEAGGITLAAQGVALEEGGLGEQIRVQNPSSHAVVMAEITGSDEVRVDPSSTPVVVAQQ